MKPAPRPTEAQCQRTIIAAAKAAGWRVHAERPAQMQSGRWSTAIQGHAGFPDLVLVRGSRVLFVELKRKPYKPTDDQLSWLIALDTADVEARVVWVPEEMDELIADLTQRKAA